VQILVAYPRRVFLYPGADLSGPAATAALALPDLAALIFFARQTKFIALAVWVLELDPDRFREKRGRVILLMGPIVRARK